MTASVHMTLPEMLTTRMSYDSERQKILAQNIASIDTPNYKAQDLMPLNFKNVLGSRMQMVNMAVTSDMHMTGAHPHTDMFRSLSQRNTFERTPVGSTVVVEEQMMKVADNSADYQLVTELYKKIGSLNKEALGLQSA